LIYIGPEIQIHDQAVLLIANEYFQTKETNMITYVNVPARKKAIRLTNGQLVYVDILVVNQQNNRAERIAEVETVVDDRSIQRWIVASTLAPYLYIYAIHGYGQKAKKILQDQRIRHMAVFEYHISPLGKLIVKPITETGSTSI
jgi:hypothetical protein